MVKNKGSIKKLLALLGLVALVATVGMVTVFALQEEDCEGLACYECPLAAECDDVFFGDNANGQITMVAPVFRTGSTGFDNEFSARVTELGNRITFARNLLNATDRGGPNPGSARTHYAPVAAYDTFESAIITAENLHTRAGIVRAGEEFEIIVSIAGNQNGGFSAMLVQLELPARLELVGVRPGASFANGFIGGPNWTSDTNRFTPARPGTTISGWGGMSTTNNTANGELMVYTVRATPGVATTTGNIVARFQNAVSGRDVPVRTNASNIQELSMSINGVTMTGTNSVNIGTVSILAA